MSELDSLVDAVPDFTATEPKKKPRAPIEALVDKVPDFTQPPSTGDDVLRTLPWIAPKAAAGFMGLPHDVNALSEAAGAKVQSMLPDSMQVPAWLRTINEALDSVSPLKQISRALPSSQDVRNLAEKATGPWYDPQTRTGKVVDTAGQTALTMGRNWLTTPVKAAAMTGAITGGTELAGALTNDNPWARLVGGLTVGGIPAVVNAARGRVGNTIRASVGDVTPEQEQAALALQARGQAEGIPLTGTESLDAGHGLAGRTVATLGGGQIMHEFTRDRPAQVAAAVDRRIIAPTRNADTPSENAARAQTAATDVLAGAEKDRTAAASPHYKAAEFETLQDPQALRPYANETQRLLFGSTIGSPTEAPLGKWYEQAFPHTVDTTPPAKLGPATTRTLGTRSVNPDVDDAVTAIRKLGGLDPKQEAVGSLAQHYPFPNDPANGAFWRAADYAHGGATNTRAGHSLDDMAGMLKERGYPVEGPDGVMDLIADHHMGKPTYSLGVDHGAMMAGADPMVALTDTLSGLDRTLRRQNLIRAESKTPKAPDTAPEFARVEPETNVGRLGSLYHELTKAADVDAIGATSADKIAAYPAGRLRGELGDVLERNSPNWKRGNEVYAAQTRDVVEPLRAGPVGRLATPSGFNAADQANVARVTGAVSDVSSVRPSDIRTMYTHLNRQDAGAFPGIAKTWVENELDAAVGENRSGPNATAGSKLHQTLYGTPKKRENFDEVMRGVAQAHGVDPNQLVAGARNLMSVLERTGRTPGIGSQTQPRAELNAHLQGSLVADAMDSLSTNPLRPFATSIRQWFSQGRDREIARILTAPDSVEQIVKLAKLRPNGLTARYYVAALLGLDRATSESGQ